MNILLKLLYLRACIYIQQQQQQQQQQLQQQQKSNSVCKAHFSYLLHVVPWNALFEK